MLTRGGYVWHTAFVPTNATVKLEKVWGDRVRERRELLGLSQRALAGFLEPPCTQQTIHKVEAGKISPRDDLKLRIAGALRCKPDDLFPWGT